MPNNKSHKQKFSSKHAVAEREQGRQVKIRAVNPKSNKPVSKESSKQAALALRKKKNDAVVHQKRIGSVGAPKILGFVPVNESGDSLRSSHEFERYLTGKVTSGNNPRTVVAQKSKQRFTIVTEVDGNEQMIVDVAKVADVMVLSLDCSQAVQETIKRIQEENAEDDDNQSFVSGTTWFSDIGLCITDLTRDIVSSLNSQGLPSVVVLLQGLETFVNAKHKQRTLKIHQRYFESVFGDHVKVLSIEAEGDMESLLRVLTTMKLRPLKWREQRPYIVVEGGSYDNESRKLTIHGYLRGSNLSANQLIHITDHGTFQMERIDALGDPNPLTRTAGSPIGVIELSDETTRESLECIQASETLEEDGLPTEADIVFEQEQHTKKKIRVPSGVSDYQASWYEFDDDAEGAHVDESEGIQVAEDEDHFVNLESLSRRTAQTEVDFLKAADVIRHERMTDEERLEEMRRLKDLSEEEVWNPDMMDTPVNLPARQRFAKYRGMKSFQTGTWDVNENLPVQYGHVFKLQGFARIRETAIEKCRHGPAQEGEYVTITLLDVPETVWSDTCFLTIASGQLEHEQKWSVLHFHVQRSNELDVPIKSKTPMLAHIGFRKFYVSPLFSDPTVGDRTRFSRYFHEGEKFRIATFFGPISYNPCPILLFLVPSLEEQAEENPLRLACFGSALPPNPDLLVLKRVVLTGRVAVIHKKQSVVKYMFFNEDDVKWFQPVDIYTKLGRRGKITKAVGTHGLFKVALNDQIMQHDIICMDLYKRVFPKWTTVAFNIADVKQIVSSEHENEDN